MKKPRNYILFSVPVLITAIAFFLSCNTETGAEHAPNTPTSGVLKVYTEEGFTIQMKSQAYTFEKIYSNAKIDVKYTTQKEAIQALYSDSCKVIAISRDLSAEEVKRFNAANLFPKSTFIFKDAIALVVNSSSPDSVISMEQLNALLSGDTSAFPGAASIVFDNTNSSSAAFLKDSLLGGKAFGRNCYAVKNTAELIEKIASSKNMIGIMDYAWLSDKDEAITREYLKKVRTLAVSLPASKTAYFPDQSNIETGDYPFTKKVYIMRRSADFSLAAGFITFVAGPKGQIMLLKAGLAPWRQPERMIEVNMSPAGGE
ncbi:MAG: PstS family phosphate ABC transporter substrate-binding protein [Bacteroidia bacterium]